MPTGTSVARPSLREYTGAHSTAEPRVDQCLSADDDEHAALPWIPAAGMTHSIQLPSSQSSTWYDRMSSTSWFRSSAARFRISRSRASRAAGDDQLLDVGRLAG
jgi:hypothetical protein